MIRTWWRYLGEKGFFSLISANFLTQFLGFGTTLLVAKFLLAEELGEIRIIQSYSALFILIGGFGINAGILKICSENRSEDEKVGVLRRSIVLSLASIVGSLALLAILSFSGIISSSQRISFWLCVYGMVIPAAVMTALLMTYLQSLKRIKEMARLQVWIKVQSFLLIVASTWVWGLPGFVLSTVAAYCLGLVPLLWQVGGSSLRGVSNPLPAGFLAVSGYSFLANGISMLGQYGDLYILDHFATDRQEIGYYSLATLFVLGASQVTHTVQSISAPYFSQNASNPVWFRKKLRSVQLGTALLGIVVALAVYAIGMFLVRFVYGPTYTSVLGYLLILLVKYVIYSSYAIMGQALFGLGFVRYNVLTVAITTPIALTLMYLGMCRSGIVDVAWAQVASSLITFLLVVFLTIIAMHKSFGTGQARGTNA